MVACLFQIGSNIVSVSLSTFFFHTLKQEWVVSPSFSLPVCIYLCSVALRYLCGLQCSWMFMYDVTRWVFVVKGCKEVHLDSCAGLNAD